MTEPLPDFNYGVALATASNDGPRLEAWEIYSWECSVCLKKLDHTNFENEMLLPYALTSGLDGAPTIPIEALASDKELAEVYSNTGKRQAFVCRECKFSRNECYAYYNNAAIQPCRYVYYPSFIERYFPRLNEDDVRAEIERCWSRARPPPRPITKLKGTRSPRVQKRGYWLTYMVRCPSCQRWQELRNYRFGPQDPCYFLPPVLPIESESPIIKPREEQLTRPSAFWEKDLQCTTCFASAAEGDIGKLAQELRHWAVDMFYREGKLFMARWDEEDEKHLGHLGDPWLMTINYRHCRWWPGRGEWEEHREWMLSLATIIRRDAPDEIGIHKYLVP